MGDDIQRDYDETDARESDLSRGYRGDRGARSMRSLVRAHVDENIHLRPKLNEMLGETTWCIDSFHWSDDELEIRGWALTPPNGYHPATFTLNGVPLDEVEYPRPRRDIGDLFWFRPGAEYSGFRCRTRTGDHSAWTEHQATLEFVDARTLQPFAPNQGFSVMAPDSVQGPLPDLERRVRVHGNDDPTSFIAQGSSAFIKLDRALRKTIGKGFADYRSILDWGCGCARVSRYFEPFKEIALHGIDIDESNIEWCRENLSFGEWSSCRVDPPLAVADETFDAIFGVSVMTHLRESDRQAWLAELSRVCMPGGVTLLTVQGPAAFCRSTAGAGQVATWEQTGSVDTGVSSAANDLSPEPERYIDCYLGHDYIRDRWSEFFEVVDILPAYVGNVQDLVVLRKRD